MRTGSKLKAIPNMIVAALLIAKEMPAQQLSPDLVKRLSGSDRISAATIDASQDEKHVYNVGGDVSPPYLISKVEPKYSKAAETAGLSGSVGLSLVIDATGVPTKIKVTRSLGLGLDKNAVEAVSKWRFRPGTKAGTPVATRAQIEVHFQLTAGTKMPATSTAGPSVPPFKTLYDVQAFMQAYYLRPRPELIGDLIEGVHSTNFAQNDSAVPSLMGFFSEIFADNPGRVPDWQILVAKQDKQTNDVFDHALSLYKAGGVLTAGGHSPQLNDEYWGAFFGSGNPKFVAKLIEQLRYYDDREDLQLFGTGATAKWSLASNAQLHPRVREAIEHQRAGADKRTQELITELLVQGPDGVKRDMREIIMRQRASGKWK